MSFVSIFLSSAVSLALHPALLYWLARLPTKTSLSPNCLLSIGNHSDDKPNGLHIISDGETITKLFSLSISDGKAKLFSIRPGAYSSCIKHIRTKQQKKVSLKMLCQHKTSGIG
jgi:hypothetical protein